jgi:hypothetical protein
VCRETDAFVNAGDDDDGQPVSRQRLLERIRQKKEIIGQLRLQPWVMHRKRRALR